MDFRAGTADTFRAVRDRLAAFAARRAGRLTSVVGIVVVSHSLALAEGVRELALQMAGPDLAIVAAGGDGDGGLGTDERLVITAIETAGRAGDGVVVVGDLGSSLLTVRSILEENPGLATLADAPIAEGAVAAAVTASVGAPLADVLKAAEEARGTSKL